MLIAYTNNFNVNVVNNNNHMKFISSPESCATHEIYIFASLDKINVILVQQNEYPLCIIKDTTSD